MGRTSTFKIIGWSALVIAALLTVSVSASAAPAYVKSTVNLRSGPDTSNEIIGRIPAGSLVQAGNCGDWCEVTWLGKSGFAIKSALDTSGRVPGQRRVARAAPPDTVYDDDVGPPVYYGAAPYYYGYRYPYYRPFGSYRYRPYYGYRYGGWRRRW